MLPLLFNDTVQIQKLGNNITGRLTSNLLSNPVHGAFL